MRKPKKIKGDKNTIVQSISTIRINNNNNKNNKNNNKKNIIQFQTATHFLVTVTFLLMLCSHLW